MSVTIPDFDYGNVSGSVMVVIDRAGVRGEFLGSYASPTGQLAVVHGSADMGSKSVCIPHLEGVPDVGGKGFCAHF